MMNQARTRSLQMEDTMKKIPLFILPIFVALCGCTAMLPGNGHIPLAPDAFSRLGAVPVVRVNSYPDKYNSYHGSGIIIDENGTILTASHCLHKNALLNVNLRSPNIFDSATPLPGKNFPNDDVAFIRADRAQGLKTALLRREKLNMAELTGKTVYLKGHRMGQKNLIIPGLLCANQSLKPALSLGRLINVLTFSSCKNKTVTARRINDCIFVQVDDKHIDGMSGGAIIMDGQVIAMIIEEWNILGATYAIGVPIYRCLELYRQP
jgi:hypothetical protein